MMIEHIALYVNDLETARTFFMKYLGAASNDGYHNPKTDFRSYFLTFDDGARLELMHKPEMPAITKAALLGLRGTRSNSRFEHIVPASAAGRTVGGKSPRRFYFYRERECICSRYPPARNILPIPLSAA